MKMFMINEHGNEKGDYKSINIIPVLENLLTYNTHKSDKSVYRQRYSRKIYNEVLKW